MTREEAIKIIDCYDIGFYDLSGEKIPADKLADAFDMAIEALQTEVVQCKDCKHYRAEYVVCTAEHWDLSRVTFPHVEPNDYCSYGENKK